MILLLSLLLSSLSYAMPNDVGHTKMGGYSEYMNMAECNEDEVFCGLYEEIKSSYSCDDYFFTQWWIEDLKRERRGLDNARHMVDISTYHRRRKSITKGIKEEENRLKEMGHLRALCKGTKIERRWMKKINQSRRVRK